MLLLLARPLLLALLSQYDLFVHPDDIFAALSFPEGDARLPHVRVLLARVLPVEVNFQLFDLVDEAGLQYILVRGHAHRLLNQAVVRLDSLLGGVDGSVHAVRRPGLFWLVGVALECHNSVVEGLAGCEAEVSVIEDVKLK